MLCCVKNSGEVSVYGPVYGYMNFPRSLVSTPSAETDYLSRKGASTTIQVPHRARLFEQQFSYQWGGSPFSYHVQSLTTASAKPPKGLPHTRSPLSERHLASSPREAFVKGVRYLKGAPWMESREDLQTRPRENPCQMSKIIHISPKLIT